MDPFRIVTWFVDLFSRAQPTVQFAVLVFLIVVAGCFFYAWMRGRHRLDEVRNERDKLRVDLREKELAISDLSARTGELRSQAEKHEATIQQLATELAKREKLLETADKHEEKLKVQYEHCREELAALQKRFDDLQKIDTDVWLGPSRDGSSPPSFVERKDRATRIISFINLKGGVGKTTLVANLASAYATGVTGRPLRVLLVDLDYQGTLSNMCVSSQFLDDRRNPQNKHTSHLLLEDSCPSNLTSAFLDALLVPVDDTNEQAKAIVADEDLDHLDFRQQARFAVERREVRFHHRQVFHSPLIQGRFDFIFSIRSVLQDQFWGGLTCTMSDQRFLQELEHRPLLQAQCLDHG